MNDREVDKLIHTKIMGYPGRIAYRFTDDISLAWQVYAWLESRGLVRVSNGDGDSKDCDFTPNDTQLKSAHVSADSYELAICLAALKAIEATQKEKTL